MSIPILSVNQIRTWEQSSWEAGCSEFDVIQAVGKRLAHALISRSQRSERFLLLAGKGHNGDDVSSAYSQLTRRRKAELVRIDDPIAGLTALQEALDRRPDWIVEGMFGIGLNRELSDPWRVIIERINASRIRVIAVDVPSGLNADTGQAQPVSVQADETITLGAPKRGLMATSAWPYVGRLQVISDIGLLPCDQASEWQWTFGDEFIGFPPTRKVGGHKGTFGHLGIVAGSRGFHGAAVLAARAAARAQPGLITLYVPESVYTPIAVQLASTMVKPCAQMNLEMERHSAWLIGPGLADPELPGGWRAWVRRCWMEADLPVIVDASALDWLPRGPIQSKAVRVITPHPGEAARLLECETSTIQSDRPAALRKLSQTYGKAWVVLKGHQTLVGCVESPVYFNGSGNPYMAQGGSGDVLAGWMAGLVAQPLLSKDILTCIRYAVWEHGVAADRLQSLRSGWTIEELVEAM